MNVRLIFLSVAALVSIASIPSFASGLKPNTKLTPKPSSLHHNALDLDEGDVPTRSSMPASSPRPASSAIDSDLVRKVGKPYSKERYQAPQNTAKVQAHSLDGKSAATLYIQDIPVFTFTGDALDQAGAAEELAATEQTKASAPKMAKAQLGQANTAQADASAPQAQPKQPSAMAYPNPLARATAIAAELNRFAQVNGTEAAEFTPDWDEEQGVYLVKLGAPSELGEAHRTLITLDSQTRFSNTTGNADEDIRQSINRLRRLMNPSAEAKIKEISAAEIARLRPEPEPEPVASGYTFGEGWASWYGPGFHGRLTANGETYNQNAMTAAHKSLPFGTLVRVTNLNNGLSAVVRINDRGPYIHGREIDLSAAAAQVVGAVQSGVAPVRMEILN